LTLIKTSILSLIATIFKVAYGLLINKLLAIYVGPSGVALIGQFQSFQQGLNGVATAGFGQGLIKYLSEFKGNVQKSQDIFSAAVKLVCIFLLPISLGLLFFSGSLAELVFATQEYEIWVQLLGMSLIPASLGALFLGALNGLHEIKKLTIVGILSSTLGIGVAFFAIPAWGVLGGVVSFLATPFLVLFVSLLMLNKSDGFSWAWFKPKVSRDSSTKLGKFTLMAIASAISIPVSHVFIRNYLTESGSLDDAGIWTGMWRISEAYLMVITVTLGVYYLPKLSSLKSVDAIKREIRSGQKLILPLVFISAISMYFMRDWIILLLFDEGFSQMAQLFSFQLLGDIMKIAAFLYGYVFIAKAQVKVFIFIELFFSMLFVFLVIFFVENYGLVGVSYAFALNYTICFFFVYWWFLRSCKQGVFDEVSDVSHS